MKWFVDFFQLTKKEYRGFFVLFVLIGVLMIFPFIFILFKNNETTDYQLVILPAEKGIHSNRTESEVLVDNPNGLLASSIHSGIKKNELFYFDPNELSLDSWKKLGLSEKQAQSIKKYEASGGKFFSKEDVRKMYTISEEFYQRIEPYIAIGLNKRVQSADKETIEVKSLKEEVKTISIDINSSDTTSWKRLNGIGSVLANRIVKFRDALGGFSNIEQIKEVYGVSEELFRKIEVNLMLNDFNLSKLNVNLADKSTLQKHPYISSKQAQLIVNYRKQHGSFHSIEDLKKIILLDEIFFRKIEPYLDYHQ